MGKKYADKNTVSEERREEIREKLMEAAGNPSLRLLSEQDIVSAADPDSHEYGAVLEELDSLVDSGRIVRSRKGRYLLPQTYDLIPGTMRRHAKGFGFVTPDSGGEDLFVPRTEMRYAINGDRVLVRMMQERHGDHRVGIVERVVSHTVTHVSGVFFPSGGRGYVLADDKRMEDILIPAGKTMNAEKGDKVRVKITDYPSERSGMKGEIAEIYGRAGDSRAEAAAILGRFDIRTEFPEDVLKEAEQIGQRLSEAEMAGRKDLREKAIVTIDGADARDFDDAVRVERTPDGGFVLYVCIADVSSYVKEGSALDREALMRGCSVYFPDRVYPMLPTQLSNGICSLNEGEDRLALTAEMDIKSDGEISGYRIYESVIRSAARMVYSDVSDILEGNGGQAEQKYSQLLPMLHDMKELAGVLEKRRFREGSIDFDVSETLIRTDDQGVVISVEPEERRVANRMIEEFMLAANRVVAEHCFWMELPFVYRVHEKPDQLKMEQLKLFAGSLGLTLKGSCENIYPKAIEELLAQAGEKGCERIIGRVALRSMKKAVYDTECRGHFGLGFRYYCHFTSPIRRYPDLIVHRILKETLHGTIGDKRWRRLGKLTEEAAEISSQRERVSVEAERAMEKMLVAVYMSGFIGERFEGVISGVVHAGFFVELENTAEGYVRAETLADDYYIYDEKNYRMIGERTKRNFSVGDRVTVEVDRVSTITGDIDFRLIDEERGRERTERTGQTERRAAESPSLSRSFQGGNSVSGGRSSQGGRSASRSRSSQDRRSASGGAADGGRKKRRGRKKK